MIKDTPRAATLVVYRVVLQDIWLYRDPNGALLPTGFHKTQVLQHAGTVRKESYNTSQKRCDKLPTLQRLYQV